MLRSAHAMFPLAIHEHREQMTMQVVHHVVFGVDAASLVGVSGTQYLLGGTTQFDCNPAHFRGVAIELFRQDMLGVAAANDLGDMSRHTPIRSTSAYPDRGDDRPQVTSDRGLQRQQTQNAASSPVALSPC
jgi:hypothetical protein